MVSCISFRCVKPYEGDPTTPGGKCKLSESISESIVSTTKKRIPGKIHIKVKLRFTVIFFIR